MNSYEVQCKVVTAALVTMTLSDAEIKESIWIATASKDGPYDLTTYIMNFLRPATTNRLILNCALL